MPASSSAVRPRRAPAAGPPVRARLVVHLLGEAAATLDGRPVPELAAPRMQRLLARVALGPAAGVPRDRLAVELWPGSSDAQARTNLRKLLHDLRRAATAAGTVVEAGPRVVRWCAEPTVWVDAVAFTAAIAEGDHAAAVRCYGGDLVPGCDDHWLVGEREHLRRLAVEALAQLAAAAATEGRDSDVVTHTRQLLEVDPLHEPACRLLMQALARRGERSEALRTYHRLVAGLERELGVRPEAETVAVAGRLRRRAAPDRTPTWTAPGTAMVGRAAEWQAVLDTWREAATGNARLLLVTGEAGIGKTRLVEELARQVAADGHDVAYGRAYAAAGSPPWGPVVDWLRSVPVRSGCAGLTGGWRAELARLLPELRTERPGAPDPPPATDVGRHHLFAAARHALLSRGRPLLLVIDDLQWCDKDTLEFCAFVIRSSPAAPVLVAGTVRDDEVPAAHPLARLRTHLAAAGVGSVVALGPLDRAATAEMASLVGARALPPDAAARLWAETEGNPLFVVEAVRAGFGTSSSPRSGLTPTVHAVITARLDRLTPGARQLAEVAATIGREFTTAVLATAAGRGEDELTDDLDELWRHHVVRERGGVFDFSHDRLREVTLELISPARRRKLHRQVAAAVEAHHTDDLGPVSARLGAHYEAAGLATRAVEAYERAGRHAYRVFALDDGIALLGRALRLLDESAPHGQVRDEVELRVRSAIGVPLVARRGYGAPEVQRCYERALTLHRRLGRRPDPSVLRGLALHAVVTCRFDQAAEMGSELMAWGGADRTAPVEGEYVLGVTTFWRGEFAAAEHHLTAAVQRYRVEDAPLHIARYAQDPKGVCLSRLALTRLFRGSPADADATMRAALRVAAELDNPMTTGYVRAFDALLAALEPRDHDLHAAVAALDAVTSRMHIGYFALLGQILAGWRDVLDGDARGIGVISRATGRLHEQQPVHVTLGLCLLARSHLRTGDTAAGRTAVAEALERTAATGQRYLLPELLRVDAAIAARAGDPARAADTARRAVTAAVELDAPWLRDRAASTLARLGTALTARR